MGKTKSSGLAADIVGVAAKLPWWLGCLLAAVVYFVLHGYATPPAVGPQAPVAAADIGAAAVGTLYRTLASIGQYLVPGLLLVGGLVSFLGARKRAALLEATGNGPTQSALATMDWRDFEMLIGEAFRQQGFRVAEQGGGGADGGVDLRLHRDSETFVVQCKHWRDQRVGVAVVRELLGVVTAEGAHGGFVVISGSFTAEAVAFAKGKALRLIDGVRLEKMLADARAARKDATPAVPASAAVPVCPKCQSAMVRRVAKQGANAGKEFWGCSTFPKCRGAVQ